MCHHALQPLSWQSNWRDVGGGGRRSATAPGTPSKIEKSTVSPAACLVSRSRRSSRPAATRLAYTSLGSIPECKQFRELEGERSIARAREGVSSYVVPRSRLHDLHPHGALHPTLLLCLRLGELHAASSLTPFAGIMRAAPVLFLLLLLLLSALKPMAGQKDAFLGGADSYGYGFAREDFDRLFAKVDRLRGMRCKPRQQHWVPGCSTGAPPLPLPPLPHAVCLRAGDWPPTGG